MWCRWMPLLLLNNSRGGLENVHKSAIAPCSLTSLDSASCDEKVLPVAICLQYRRDLFAHRYWPLSQEYRNQLSEKFRKERPCWRRFS